MISKANIEAAKEVLRWVVLFVLSWIVTETLKQAVAIPEFYQLHVSVFVYMIPLRAGIVFALTMVGRYADKWLFEKTKADSSTDTKGILPF